MRSIQRGIPGRAAIHTWLVRAPDAPPDVVVRIESGPGIASETTARFEFSGAQEYECRLLPAEDDFAPCLPQYDDLSEDDYVLEVRATGSRTVVTYPFAVVIPPDVTIDQAPASSNGEAVTFVFSAPDNADSFECRLDGGAFEPCEKPKRTRVGTSPRTGFTRSRCARSSAAYGARPTFMPGTSTPSNDRRRGRSGKEPR